MAIVKRDEFDSFEERVRNFEDGVNRLSMSANLAYDSDLHMSLTKEYGKILTDLHTSIMEEEHKNYFRTIIVDVLEEAILDIKKLIK